MMPVSTTGYLEAPWDALEGSVTGEQDGLLSVGPLKLVFDGANSCAMCLSWWQLAGSIVSTLALTVRQGSLDSARLGMSGSPRAGRRIRSGIHLYRPDEARALVQKAAERGFALASHATGNDAIASALSAYEAAGAALGRRGSPRLEHVIFAGRDLVERIAGVGAIVVAQPHFLSLPAFGAAPRIPGLPTKPLRWLLDAGVTVAGSSDFPVTGFDPFDGIRSAVRRRASNGRVVDGDQSVTLDEALGLYTRDAASAAGCLRDCGTLEAGKRADLVVLDRRLKESELDVVRVRATIVGGDVAFGSVS
jgi:predicted amidohydrolase YtcJ